MANLIGYLTYGHHANTIHRLAHDKITSKLGTYHTFVDAGLDKYGRAIISIERDGKMIKQFKYNVPENMDSFRLDRLKELRKNNKR